MDYDKLVTDLADQITNLERDVDYVDQCTADIHERAGTEPFTDDDDTAFKAGIEFVKNTRAKIADLKVRHADAETRAKAARHAAAGNDARPDVPNFIPDRSDPFDVALDRDSSPGELRDGILAQLEERDVDDAHVRVLLKRHRSDTAWARNLLARSSDAYEGAWQKYMVGQSALWTADEQRQIAVGTNTQGGFLVPTHLDPTVILSNDGSTNAVRQIARVVTLTTADGNTWNGVSSAGTTANWAGELVEVADGSPEYAGPSVSLHKAHALVQASVEAFADIANLQADTLMMFADARDRLEGTAHCVGTGSGQPTGIFTAIDANAAREVVTTTAATIGLVDLQATRRKVGPRWRGRGSWLMNPTWADEVKALGTALSASYSTDITQSNTDLLLGRPVVETDDAPETVTTTALDQRIVFGDFRDYVIVDKPGSTSVEFIPHMFNTANNLPDGRRGWYMWFRNGADSVNDNAFSLLVDKTSA